MSTHTVWIKLEFSGPDADDAHNLVSEFLDTGTLQDGLASLAVDLGGNVKLESATVEDPP